MTIWCFNCESFRATPSCADCNGALAVEAFAWGEAAFRADVHNLRPHRGQIKSAGNLRKMLKGSTLVGMNADLITLIMRNMEVVTKNNTAKTTRRKNDKATRQLFDSLYSTSSWGS